MLSDIFFPTQCIHNARNEINLLCTSVLLSGAASGQDFPVCYKWGKLHCPFTNLFREQKNL